MKSSFDFKMIEDESEQVKIHMECLIVSTLRDI